MQITPQASQSLVKSCHTLGNVCLFEATEHIILSHPVFVRSPHCLCSSSAFGGRLRGASKSGRAKEVAEGSGEEAFRRGSRPALQGRRPGCPRNAPKLVSRRHNAGVRWTEKGAHSFPPHAANAGPHHRTTWCLLTRRVPIYVDVVSSREVKCFPHALRVSEDPITVYGRFWGLQKQTSGKCAL